MSDRYTPNGDGTYTAIPPCSRCGSTCFLLHEDRAPECLTCFVRLERAEVRRARYVRAVCGD